jgi:hypothetical protein
MWTSHRCTISQGRSPSTLPSQATCSRSRSCSLDRWRAMSGDSQGHFTKRTAAASLPTTTRRSSYQRADASHLAARCSCHHVTPVRPKRVFQRRGLAPQATKACWDFEGIYCSSRHIPGVRFAGLIHPGLIGTAPSQARPRPQRGSPATSKRGFSARTAAPHGRCPVTPSERPHQELLDMWNARERALVGAPGPSPPCLRGVHSAGHPALHASAPRP